MKKLLIVIPCMFILGCSILSPIPRQQDTWDVNSLKEEERTFRIKEQTIKVDGKWKSIKFDEGWYVVSEDHIKTFNENQDDLIEALTKLKQERRQKTYLLTGMAVVSLLLLLIVLVKLIRRIK